jgi:hypothetical protein
MHKDKNNNDYPGPAFDLTFCFEALIILEESIEKLNYIGNFTYSNSAQTMSKSIGQQIDKLMKRQQELEKEFEELIIEKTSKIELVDQAKIDKLVMQIQKCAEDLKISTNNICKSLAENPDIPLNLKKAKDDKNLIKNKLENIKGDLVSCSFTMFDNIKEEIRRNNTNIEEQRRTEMNLFERLRKLNEDLIKEQIEYEKDQKNLNNKLANKKKELAKAKMESKFVKEYRYKELGALQNLKETNFNDNELNLQKYIEEKLKEKVSIYIKNRKKK